VADTGNPGGGIALKSLVAGLFLGAVVALVVPLFYNWRKRSTERYGELVAALRELNISREAIDALSIEKAAMPLYRLPTTISDVALPKLIGDGMLSDLEAIAIIDYLARVHELNNCLQRASVAQAACEDAAVSDEFKRTVAKAREIVDSSTGYSCHDKAHMTISGVINRPSMLRVPVLWRPKRDHPLTKSRGPWGVEDERVPH
jgi:hypothetical protein